MASDSHNSSMYESALLGILQNEEKIDRFLDVVFKFLYTRTDFFHVMTKDNDKIGFPPNAASKIVMQVFGKYAALAGKRDAKPEVTAVTGETSSLTRKAETEAIVKARSESAACADSRAVSAGSISAGSVSAGSVSAGSVSAGSVSAGSNSQETFQANPESHNGAIREGYRWAQTLTDCDLRIKIPRDVTKAKQMEVSLQRKHLKVCCMDESNSRLTLIDSDLAWDICVDESLWSITPGDCLQINMEKVQERWWEHVFVDEPKIDTKKIDAVVAMEDLDEGAQATIDRLMYDEHNKRLGKPTSQQQSIQNTLKQAWNAEGSPFKGTEFDPSLVNITTNGQFCSDLP